MYMTKEIVTFTIVDLALWLFTFLLFLNGTFWFIVMGLITFMATITGLLALWEISEARKWERYMKPRGEYHGRYRRSLVVRIHNRIREFRKGAVGLLEVILLCIASILGGIVLVFLLDAL